MKSEFALAFNQICAEYSLPREVVLDAVRAALVTAYRRDWKLPTTQNVLAEINLDTGLARIFVERTAVGEVEDEQLEISLEEARRRKPRVEEGDVIRVDVTPHDFGRIAAQTAKQVITQRLREAERESQFNRFSRQENEIIIGTVQSISPHGITLHLERTEEAIMPRREQIPGERYTLHQKIRVYVLEVRRTPRGPEIIVSRSHPLMLRRLLELEVPEIRQGTLEINAVAREAGTRAKVAVSTEQPGLDPVGACVGMRGIRIQTISRELHGERIDVLQWDPKPETFIKNALSVPNILCVTLDEHNSGGPTASVVVDDNQLSLAIGRSGQNARLAAKLTNWRIDIQGATEAAMWALEQVNKTPELLDHLRSAAQLIPRLAAVMRTHERDHYPYTQEEYNIIGTTVKAVREVLIAQRNAERPGARQARARRTAQKKVEAARQQARQDARARVPRGAYKVPLDDLDFPSKVYSHLINNGLSNVGEVMERMAMGDEALLMLNGVGVKTLRDIKEAVANSGLSLLDESLLEEEEQAPEVIAEEEEVTEPVEAIAPEGVEEEAEPDVAAEPATVAEAEPVVEPEPVAATPEAAMQEVAAAQDAVETTTLEAEEEEDEEGEEEDVFDVDFSDVVEEIGDELFIEPEEEEFPDDDSRKKRKRKRRRRTVVYDEKTGETFVVRKRRGGPNAWEEYEDF